jgi:hypothetical protein
MTTHRDEELRKRAQIFFEQERARRQMDRATAEMIARREETARLRQLRLSRDAAGRKAASAAKGTAKTKETRRRTHEAGALPLAVSAPATAK